MDYDGLRLFLDLSRTLHFVRTSRQAHVSPSALSRAVQRLEREAGVDVAGTRSPHGRVDPERRALRRARARHAGALAAAAARAGRTPAIGCRAASRCSRRSPLARASCPSCCGDFRQRHPDIHIRLETGYAADALDELAEGRVDVSVAAIPPRLPRGLVARVLIFTPLVFVAPRVAGEVERMCHQQPLPWTELPVVLPASGQARDSADRWFRRRRITPLIYGEVPGNEAILALVSLGCGVGVVPRLVMDESPLQAKLSVLNVDGEGDALGEFRVGVCTQRKKLASPLVRALWDSFAARTRVSSMT